MYQSSVILITMVNQDVRDAEEEEEEATKSNYMWTVLIQRVDEAES